MSDDQIDSSLEVILERLYSNDANDRVKAAGELGEVGTPEVAPKLLEVTYEDEASTVRQMAIQSYSEILGSDSLDEVIKCAANHFDEYVRLYSVMILGRVGGSKVESPLQNYIHDDDQKVQAAALRAMIHAELKNNGKRVFDVLEKAEKPIIIRNCIEALALWGYKDAKDYIKENFLENPSMKDLELKTISAFYLAAIGDKSGKTYLENERVDNYVRIAIDDTHYRGNQGLINAASKLN